MFLRRFGMYIGIFVVTLCLAMTLDNPQLAGLIVIGIFMPSYIWISIRRQRKRINRLEEACDPYDFIEATDLQCEITGKNKRFGTWLKLDRTAGLLCAGLFEEAKQELEKLDQKIIQKSKNAKYVYNNNMYVCLQGLEMEEEARAFYENEIASENPKHKMLQLASLFSKLSYEMNVNHADISLEVINELKQRKMSKRLSLQLELVEGEWELANGNANAAIEHFEKVVQEGNKLHLVTVAKKYMAQM